MDAPVEDDACDVMIFDCPPSFSLPCISAIAASDTVIVPIMPGAFEMSGMRGCLLDQIASVVEHRPCQAQCFRSADHLAQR
ncbi:MAG: ParA family protein [Butyricicoccaceae bacterium]